jgi:peptide/nickel transport system permease protein
VAVVAVVVLGLIILLAVAAPLITPQNPYDLASLVLTDARRPPGFVG